MIRRLVFAAALLAAACTNESDLPRLFPVPNAALVDESGKTVRLDANRGYVTVYDFIFTNCAGTCPLMTSTMRKLTAKVNKDAKVRFVSISVDPDRDTPTVLRDYASRYRNDPRWTFLTGDKAAIVDLSVNGFKLAAGGPPVPGNEPLLHSSKLIIADKSGTIREYYGALNDDAPEHVAGTISELLRE
jgi:protein SCO1